MRVFRCAWYQPLLGRQNAPEITGQDSTMLYIYTRIYIIQPTQLIICRYCTYKGGYSPPKTSEIDLPNI